MKHLKIFIKWLFASPCDTKLSEVDKAIIRRITEEANLIASNTNYLKGISVPERRKEQRK